MRSARKAYTGTRHTDSGFKLDDGINVISRDGNNAGADIAKLLKEQRRAAAFNTAIAQSCHNSILNAYSYYHISTCIAGRERGLLWKKKSGIRQKRTPLFLYILPEGQDFPAKPFFLMRAVPPVACEPDLPPVPALPCGQPGYAEPAASPSR